MKSSTRMYTRDSALSDRAPREREVVDGTMESAND